MDNQLAKIRRNIHTYPFKYQHFEAREFFALEAGVIYIHIPFCNTKCHFCDYTVYINKTDDVKEHYVAALCKEIERFAEDRAFPRFRIEAIYIGGGTPGVLTGEQLTRILRACQQSYDLAGDCEICAEFDPASVEREKLHQIAEAGYNRVSVGVQSFNDELLRRSNRPHDAEAIGRAFEAIGEAKFTHVNLDLIYPLPGLTMDIWRDSVARAIELGPSCVTIYGLEVWPGTAYYKWLEKGKLGLPDGGAEVEMYTHAMEELTKVGYTSGSTSGYYHPARTRRYCRFLDFYWRTWPMIGFGVSSKSVIHNRAWTNIRPLSDYMRRVDANESVMDFGTYLTKSQEMRRVMIRGLKMCSVDKAYFLERFGVSMESVFRREIDTLVEDGLLDDTETSVSLTPKGKILATNVYERFYTTDDLRPPNPGEVQFGISALIAG